MCSSIASLMQLKYLQVAIPTVLVSGCFDNYYQCGLV